MQESYSDSLTDEQKADALRQGTPLIFSQLTDSETEESRSKRTIKAEWIQALVSFTHSVDVPIAIRNAIVKGHLNIQYCTFALGISVVSTEFTDEIDFSFCIFQQAAQFEACLFRKQAMFQGARTAHNFVLRKSVFKEESWFIDMHVSEALMCSGAEFQDAYFDRIKVGAAALFGATQTSEAARFQGEARFHSASIGNEFLANKVTFSSRAVFDALRIEGRAHFQDATFNGEARFTDSKISGSLECNGIQFNGILHLDRSRIGGGAFFGISPTKRFPLFADLAVFLSCIVQGQVVFDSATFKGTSLFANARFEQEVYFVASNFMGAVTFDNASFGQVKLLNSVEFFADVRFLLVTVHGTFESSGTQFHANTVFDGIEVEGPVFFKASEQGKTTKWLSDVSFVGSKFRKQVNFEETIFRGETYFMATIFDADAHFINAEFFNVCSFERMRVGGSAFFGESLDMPPIPACRFRSEVNFGAVEIAGTAHFKKVTFHGKNTFLLFDSTRIHGSVNFEQSEIAGQASFLGLIVDGQANFRGARFQSNISFDGSKIRGHLHFGQSVSQQAAVFFSETRFDHAEIGGSANFIGVTFNGNASFATTQFLGGASFQGAEFKNTLLFRSTKFYQFAIFDSTTLHERTDFSHTIFDGESHFSGAIFKSETNFRACQFKGLTNFSSTAIAKGAHFEKVSFEHSEFRQNAQFQETAFRNSVSFEGTTFKELLLSPNGNIANEEQFANAINLRGCTYERIQGSWQSILRYPNGKCRLTIFDRQPYVEMEKALRSVAQDHEADNIFLERRRIERENKWKNKEFWSWLKDYAYRQFLNYGVRPYQLFWICLIVLSIGTLAFEKPHAVERKVDNSHSPSLTTLRPLVPRLSFSQAVRVSFRSFLPIDVPLLPEYIPSNERWFLFFDFIDLFAILKIFGWLLVPVGIAALTGVLRRAR